MFQLIKIAQKYVVVDVREDTELGRLKLACDSK